MPTTSGPRVGLAIVRVWLEDGHPSPLRARVTTIDDITGPPSESAVWSGGELEAVLAHVHAWLASWVAESRGP
jgi:hypothetical protein